MKVSLSINNYRCFRTPLQLNLQSGLTAFIGVNNAGKSALLKFFFECRELFVRLTSVESIGRLLNTTNSFKVNGVDDPSQIFCNGNTDPIEVSFHITPESTDVDPTVVPKRLMLTIHRNNEVKARMRLRNDTWMSGQMTVLGQAIQDGSGSIASLASFVEFIRPFASTMYLGPFRNAVNLGASHHYFDILTGDAFIQDWRTQKTGSNISANEACYALTRDIGRIFGFEELEINADSEARTLKCLINGKSYRLDDLGSGIAQFVLVLANCALKRPSIILIDEPEMNLHPSLQRLFLTTLASYTTHGVVFATHNLGLARSTADQIYTFKRVAQSNSEVYAYEVTPHLVELIGELGFSAYEDHGFKSILLVEGVTDVKVMDYFLRLWDRHHNRVLLPLGGSDLIKGSAQVELAEIRRLSKDINAVIDSERASPSAPIPEGRQQFKRLCEDLGIQCHILERRATENYFTSVALERAFPDKGYTSMQHFDETCVWKKRNNWRVAREMTREELANTDLGKFIQGLS